MYRAWDPRLDREVALKLVRRLESSDDSLGSLVIDEGRLLARVRHPNVVTVYGADRIDGRVGLYMEFVRGRTLEVVLRDHGPFGAQEATLIGLDLCRALSAVHRAGSIHRDIKAQNVMREAGGRIVLMDFGAGLEDLAGRPAELAGTPLYLAPEVFDGRPATARSDTYSVGVLLFHLVTGSYPVKGRSVADIREAHGQRHRTWLRDDRPDLPDRFVQAVERALEVDPELRYESAGAMEAALTRVVSVSDTAMDAPALDATSSPVLATRRPITAAVRGWSIAATLVIAAAVGVDWWKWTASTTRSPTPQLVLVAAFDNRSGDARLDDVVQFALEQELAQSHAVSVVTRERAADTLKLMQRPIDTRVDATLAREVCLRDGGIGLFAGGRIDRVGSHYAVNVTLIDARTGRSVARAGVDAPDLDAVLGSVKSLAAQLRAASAKSGRSFRPMLSSKKRRPDRSARCAPIQRVSPSSTNGAGPRPKCRSETPCERIPHLPPRTGCWRTPCATRGGQRPNTSRQRSAPSPCRTRCPIARSTSSPAATTT